MNSEQLEKYSSAVTLSDMENFVFPELMFSLVLADIMSPIIWKWRELECFKKLESKSSYKKLMRLKQFIIDEYEFNLDLETWGLTSKEKELKRFEKFVSSEDIAKSNALFGYEGDKYYFDVDIRRHFGLDKYDSDIIPYWKTETIEAMNAFRLKDGYKSSAGECVSLAALYVAAAFVVCRIPLEDIYMVLTPLHSQNFICLQDGVLTNNRRLLTKTMWFNGTAISNKAQRALRNENVTILAHSSGYVHCMYDDATIDRKAYKYFVRQLGLFLSSELTLPVFASFLRANRDYQKFFQVCRQCRGQAQFLKAEARFVDELADFLHIEANLPSLDKNFLPAEPIEICVDDGREQIIDYLQSIRRSNTTADLAFYAYRDMESCDWTPFIKAAVERNPVSIDRTKSMSVEQVYDWLEQIKNDSIYDGKRLAQPDEVANYKTGAEQCLGIMKKSDDRADESRNSK